MRLITSDNDYGKQFSVRKTYLLTLTQVWFFGTVGQPWWQFGHKHRSGSRNRWGPGSCGTEGEGSGKMGIYKSDKCMAFKVWAKLRISCEFQIKLCSILKKKLILSNIVQNEIYGQFAYILYLLVQNNVRFNNCQAMVSNFKGGGEENISFFRRIFLEYIFFKSVTDTSKYIWWAWFITLIYRTFVYLCSLLISGCSSFPSDNFRHGLNGSHVNLNNILNIFQSFVNIQCFRQEFTITCRYICTGQRKRPHRYTCSHTHRPMSAPVDGSDPCKCKLRLKKVKMLFRQTDK